MSANDRIVFVLGAEELHPLSNLREISDFEVIEDDARHVDS